jgi:hypothetical protein
MGQTVAMVMNTTNTPKWKTVTLSLTNMDLRNKMNGGDFQLVWISGSDTIFGFLEFTISSADVCAASGSTTGAASGSVDVTSGATATTAGTEATTGTEDVAAMAASTGINFMCLIFVVLIYFI